MFFRSVFLHLIVAIGLGIFAGIITGLTPGVHINLVATLLVSVSPILLSHTNAAVLGVFIIAMSVTHVFLDALPSIFLGAPDASTALGVLPGHRYLLNGLGLMAVKLTIIGSFGALLMSVVLFPLFVPIVRYGYPFLAKIMFWLLLATAVFMILRDRKQAWAVVVFVLSGILGVLVLKTNLNLREPMLPLLSGLFGISTLVMSIKEKNIIPPQYQTTKIKLKTKTAIKAVASGQCSGFITAIMPGLGASTAAVMSMQFTRKLGDHGFMILMGAIGTANFVLSLAALLVLDKARNGSIVAVQKLMEHMNMQALIIFLSTALIAGGIGVVLALFFGRIFCRIISRVNYQKVALMIILFITLITLLLTGWLGGVVLVVSTAVGLIPAIVKTTRTHAMACLLVPVMMYFWPF